MHQDLTNTFHEVKVFLEVQLIVHALRLLRLLNIFLVWKVDRGKVQQVDSGNDHMGVP